MFESSIPNKVGKAHTSCEAQPGYEDGSTQITAKKCVMRLFVAILGAAFIMFSMNDGLGEAGMRSIRICRAVAQGKVEANYRSSVQYTSSCVALHLPTRQNSVKATNRHYVISSDLVLAASNDGARIAGAVRYFGRTFGEFRHVAQPRMFHVSIK